MLVDSHCHLDFPDFAEELDDVVARAHRAGVAQMLTICTKVREFDRILKIAERYANIHCSVGLHPHEAEAEPELTTEALLHHARHEKVVGIGETGLDYYYDHAPRELQQTQFRRHIAAARESGLPLIVHTRNADADMAQILTQEMEKGPFTGVLHCFSSTPELAEKALHLGFYISLSGILTFKNAESLRKIAKTVPKDRLLVETDAPYLAPVPNRGKRNEPAFVVHTAAKLAELRDVAVADIYQQTTSNYLTLFHKAQISDA